MDYIQDEEQAALGKLQWNSRFLTLSEFLKRFSLPQLVSVVGGFYGNGEQSILSRNQLLCLHSIKSIEKLQGRDNSGREISILVECKNKVEVRPWNLKDVYESVKELCTVFPRYVRVSQGYYCPSTDEEILNVGDKLHLKSITKSKKGKEKLICVNQNEHTIELPKDCAAGFLPLTDGEEYYLSEVIKKFTMPVYVQFVDQFGTGEETPLEDKSLCHPLGTICLEKKNNETVVVATSIRRDDGRRSTVTFSPDVDICLVTCEDMLRDSTEYVELCQSLSQYVDFENVGPDIFEYVEDINSKKPNTKSLSTEDYIKMGGEFYNFYGRYNAGQTSQISKNKRSDETQQINAEESEIYEEIEPKSTECSKASVYTELSPVYIMTTRHEYENPLKPTEQQLSEKKSETQGGSSNKKEFARFRPPLRKLLSVAGSNQPDDWGSNSQSYGNGNPPPVPMKLPLRPRESTIPQNPQLRDSWTSLRKKPPPIPPRPQFPDRLPPLPKRPGVPDKKPALPDRNPATPDQAIPVSERPKTRDSKIVLRDSPPQLPDRFMVPVLPTSPSDRPLPLHISEKAAITPELQKDEIHEAIANFPSDFSSLSVADVCTLLKYLGMETYVEVFQAELVDGEILASMDRESLESLNISAFHVKKLLKFIGGWRPNVQ